MLYTRFEAEFAKAVKATENYYNTYYSLQNYSKFSRLILSQYVVTILSGHTTSDNNAFRAIVTAHGDLNILKTIVIDFDQKDKNELLSRAILSGYNNEAIKWIIQNGADVNAGFMGETPLMNAANNPKLLKVLLAHGADIKGQTSFGKTALFYAIQFGNIDSVKVLLNADADINHALNPAPSDVNMKDEDFNDRYSYTPITKICSFTPLVYAKRYADKPVIKLLLKRGAKIGKADPKIIKEWIQEGGLDL